MNALTEFKSGQLSSVFANQQADNDLSAGVQGGFAVIRYKGGKWQISHRGTSVTLMRDDGDGPRNSIEVVILKASSAISKTWYENGYVEGSTAAPDCSSANGLTPDAGSAKKQAQTCAMCPKNAWGSRITPEGKKGKACSDYKRLAVVPMADIKNEFYGGPMYLRVPAASLQGLAQYGDMMQKMGFPYYAIATRIKFDVTQAYPKFEFEPIRPLSDAEGAAVLDHRNGTLVDRILAEQEVDTDQPQLPAAFAQAAAQMAAPAPQPVAAPVQPTPQPAPAPTQAGGFGVVTPQVTQPAQPAQPAPAPAPTGFGPTSAAPQAAPQTTAAPQAAPQTTAAPQAGAFEASLDNKLKGLIG